MKQGSKVAAALLGILAFGTVLAIPGVAESKRTARQTTPKATVVSTTRAKGRRSTSTSATPTNGVTKPPTTQASTRGPVVGGCAVFPADNAWNRDVSTAKVHPMSAAWVAAVNASRSTLHPDVGSNPDYGIPFVVVPPTQPAVAVRYTDYGDESDPGPFPIPPNAPVEGGGDRHVIVVQEQTCQLFELFNTRRTSTGWDASSGARFDLRSNTLRPATWTSADAAGLPIFPGLLRVDEVRSGEIRHALRFTVSRTQNGFIAPARHQAGRNDATLPPMGARFRLRSDVNLSGFHGDAVVILRALQRYGMLVADNGSSWFISGATDPRWNDDDLGQLKRVPGSWFEVVDTGPIEH